MRLAIDTHYFEEGFGGIQSFIEWILGDKILEEIFKKKDVEKNLFFYNKVLRFDNSDKKGFPILSKDKTSFYKKAKFFKKIHWFFWFNFILPSRLKKHKIDIFLSPNHFLPLVKRVKKEVVVIHDFAWRVNPKWKNFGYRIYSRFFQKMSLNRASKILVISQNTKNDLQRFYNVPEGKIFLLKPKPLPIFRPREKTNKKLKEIQKKYKLPENFILFVGQIEERKNIDVVLKTINEVVGSGSRGLKLVIVGSLGFGKKKYLKKIKGNQNIFWFKWVPLEDLAYFYNLAKLFFLPSLYEGLCFPVLEAINSGIPVIVSNTSSFPEIVGKRGIMLAPYNYRGFCEAIRKLITNSERPDARDN